MIAAVLRAQLLSMWPRRGLGGGTGAGAVAALMVLGFWSFVAWGAFLFFSSPGQGTWFLPLLSSGLLFIALYWQFAPVISASFGASLELRKLLGYPVPLETLFRIEVLLRVTTCWEMFVVLSGIAGGLVVNPEFGPAAAPRILAAALVFAATNVLVSAGTRSWMERVMARARYRELGAFVLVGISLLPQLLVRSRPPAWVKPLILRLLPTHILWPWGAAAHWMLGDAAFAAAAWAALSLVAAYLFGRWQFLRGLRFDGETAAEPRAALPRVAWSDAVFRLPGRLLPDPVGALLEKELRLWSRIPRFRLLYPMACAFGPVFFSRIGARRGPGHPELLLPLMAVYGLLQLGQITFWNAFGFDRSAAQGYFSWPVRFRDVLVAKNLAVLCLLPPMVVANALIARAFGLNATPGMVAETVVTLLLAAVYWCALGNLFSVRYPVPMAASAMGRGSDRMHSLALLGAPLVLLPIVLAYWARWFFDSSPVFWGVLAVAALVGGIFYWVGLDSASADAFAGRERLLGELAGGEGPVSPG